MKSAPAKIIFLDRDGVINRFPGKGLYVVREDAFEFLPGALEAIRLLTVAGYELHVVSNQGCVARGMISRRELDRLTDRMLMAARREGGLIREVHYCVHQKSDGCLCKKPHTLLYEQALAGRPVQADMFVIGDSVEDMEAARRLGVGKLLVLSGRTQREDLGSFAPTPDCIKDNLLDAVRWILRKKS